jgi:hypothetical protein
MHGRWGTGWHAQALLVSLPLPRRITRRQDAISLRSPVPSFTGLLINYVRAVSRAHRSISRFGMPGGPPLTMTGHLLASKPDKMAADELGVAVIKACFRHEISVSGPDRFVRHRAIKNVLVRGRKVHAWPGGQRRLEHSVRPPGRRGRVL